MISRYDNRHRDGEAQHWSNESTLGSRAFFRVSDRPPRLRIEDVSTEDEGVYKCRVDYMEAPTRTSNVFLQVIGESLGFTGMDVKEWNY